MTPFKAVYVKEATTIHDYSPGTNNTASIDATLVEHQRLISVLKEALEHTRQRMTKQANKKRMEKQFQVGELVCLRLRNYRQQSVAARDNQKLSKRYFGPYQILEKVGPVAYRLELPVTSRVHPIFHVSLLKESHQEQEPSSKFPTEWLTNSPSLEPHPENILQRRITGNKEEVLVKWKHHDTSEATWEDWLEFMHRFLVFVGHEDMSAVQGETNDTPEPSAAVCNDCGIVVDAFIPYKKSKAGKRFAFVRFIKVDNIDHLVMNLCTIWIGCFHIHENVSHFHRELKPFAPFYPSNANEKCSLGSYVSILKSGKTNNVMFDQVLPSLILDDSCLPLKVWTRNTFVKLASKWGNLVEWEDLAKNLYFVSVLYVKTKLNEILVERFKVIVKGSGVRAKEMEAWDPFICNDSYESESFDDEKDAEDDGSQSGDKVTSDNYVKGVSESSSIPNNDLLYDNNHNNMISDKHKVPFEDPFNLYDILNKRKDSGDDLKYPLGFTPSMINVEEVNKNVKRDTRDEVNEHVNSTSNKLEEFIPKENFSSKNSVCSKRVHTGGSIFQLMEKLVKIFVVEKTQQHNSIDSLEAAQKSKVRWAIEADQFTNRLSLEQQADLERNVSNEEIKSAIWDCGMNKSPSLDSFTFEFFRRYWKLLEHDIVQPLKNFFLQLDIIREVTVLRTKDINLLNLILRNAGNGVNTLFWMDHLLDDLALKHKFSKLYALDNYKQITVVKKINHAFMVDTFCRPPRGGVEEEQLGFLLSRMDGLILTNIPDRWVWSLEATSEFSVKYVHQLIDDSILLKEKVAT
nr:reverse transcriptase [Tanacetum cinerariifolium]